MLAAAGGGDCGAAGAARVRRKAGAGEQTGKTGSTAKTGTATDTTGAAKTDKAGADKTETAKSGDKSSQQTADTGKSGAADPSGSTGSGNSSSSGSGSGSTGSSGSGNSSSGNSGSSGNTGSSGESYSEPVYTPTPQPAPEPEPQPTSQPEPVTPVHTHSYTDTVIAPTCTTNGYTVHTCDCGDSYTDSNVSAWGHEWEAVYETRTVEKTVTEEHVFCRGCGADITDLTLDEKTAHSRDHALKGESSSRYEDYVEVTQNVTEEVLVGYTCSRCGGTKTP